MLGSRCRDSLFGRNPRGVGFREPCGDPIAVLGDGNCGFVGRGLGGGHGRKGRGKAIALRAERVHRCVRGIPGDGHLVERRGHSIAFRLERSRGVLRHGSRCRSLGMGGCDCIAFGGHRRQCRVGRDAGRLDIF